MQTEAYAIASRLSKLEKLFERVLLKISWETSEEGVLCGGDNESVDMWLGLQTTKALCTRT